MDKWFDDAIQVDWPCHAGCGSYWRVRLKGRWYCSGRRCHHDDHDKTRVEVVRRARLHTG